MKRGASVKHEMNNELILERKMLPFHQALKLDYTKCIGCGVCESICPEEAVKHVPAMAKDGRLVKKPLVDFVPTQCTFCGECVVLCPTNALKLKKNGEEKIPVVDAEAFPVLLKDVTVDVGKCDPVCSLSCEKECPTKAVNVTTEKRRDVIEKILDVKVDREKCIFCGRCESLCTRSAFHVEKPIYGTIRLNSNLCPKGCQICVDVCPSKAISLRQDGKPSVLEEFCIYCGACQKSCPENAVVVGRTRVLHAEVKSGAWIAALEKLTSSDSMFKKFNATSAKRSREAVSTIER